MTTSSTKPPGHYDLAQLREWLRPRLEQPGGLTCPLCTQHAQAYKRTPTGPMIGVMAQMLSRSELVPEDRFTNTVEDAAKYEGRRAASEGKYVYLPDIPQKTRDVATLQYWGLIFEDPDRRGWWRVTTEGILFLRGQTSIKKYAHVYNGACYHHSGPNIKVGDVEPGFDLDRLIGEQA